MRCTGYKVSLLSTEWVDYVEEPIKYRAFMHHFLVGGLMGSVGFVGWWWVGGVRVGSGEVGGWWGGRVGEAIMCTDFGGIDSVHMRPYNCFIYYCKSH